jgi:aspartate dehydrogenase
VTTIGNRRGRPPLRLAIVGWGAIARRVVQLLDERKTNVDLLGIGTRTMLEGENALPAGVAWLSGPESLSEIGADLVVEAAGPSAVEAWGHAALKRGRNCAVCSTSAFCEHGLLDRLIDSAERSGGRILIPSGALAAVDALSAASILPLASVTHSIVKPPRAWLGTPAEAIVDLHTLASRTVFFEGTAREAAQRFPANANVAAITALAGIGFDRTTVVLVADPSAHRNSHRLQVTGDFGAFDMTIENRPLTTNPKSSELTALALVRLIENQSGVLAL